MKKLSDVYIRTSVSEQDFKSIIVRSDNKLTDKLIAELLPLESLTEQLNSLLSNNFPPLEVPETWGRFQVSGAMVFLFYKALTEDTGVEAKQVLTWMEEVEPSQRFGVDGSSAMKAGWDLTDALQLILLLVKVDGTNVKVLSASNSHLNSNDVKRWRELEALSPEGVVGFHEKFFTQELRTFHYLSK